MILVICNLMALTLLALLLALVSRGNERQAKVPIFEAPNLSRGILTNVWQLQEVGDFEAINCPASTELDRSTMLHLTTEPPISCRCCVRPVWRDYIPDGNLV
jgi:hypothetical protein